MADGTVEALVFDVFGTVVDWRGSIIAEVEALGRSKRLEVDAAGFADAWRAAYQPSMQRVRDGEIGWTNLDRLHRMSLETLVARFGLEALDETEREHLNRAWHRLHAWPDAVPGLLRLRRRYIVATLSNGNVALLTNMARYAGLPWDCILGAEIFRRYKPDPAVYAGAAAYLGLAPSQVMMVAAHNGDLAAAQATGLRAAFVRRPDEHGPQQTTDLEPTGDYDAAAEDFLDLAVRLGC